MKKKPKPKRKAGVHQSKRPALICPHCDKTLVTDASIRSPYPQRYMLSCWCGLRGPWCDSLDDAYDVMAAILGVGPNVRRSKSPLVLSRPTYDNGSYGVHTGTGLLIGVLREKHLNRFDGGVLCRKGESVFVDVALTIREKGGT